jgi:hypothetical protein
VLPSYSIKFARKEAARGCCSCRALCSRDSHAWRVNRALSACAQAVIDAQIIPPLIKLLATAEFDIQKEAAWAISNATSGGSQEQIK